LIACIDEPLKVIRNEKAVLIPTGLAIHIGDGSIAGIILPRSGLGHKQGLVLGNSLGLIDGDYQNQWFVSAWNRGQQEEIVINPGDRIAQAIFVPVIHPEFVYVNAFSRETERGLGGFGSTGK
jgi:dUTP pyrophosphatase